jgi:hypothetical protein
MRSTTILYSPQLSSLFIICMTNSQITSTRPRAEPRRSVISIRTDISNVWLYLFDSLFANNRLHTTRPWTAGGEYSMVTAASDSCQMRIVNHLFYYPTRNAICEFHRLTWMLYALSKTRIAFVYETHILRCYANFASIVNCVLLLFIYSFIYSMLSVLVHRKRWPNWVCYTCYNTCVDSVDM